MIQWVQNPTDINSLRDFAEWKEKCDIKAGITLKLIFTFYILKKLNGQFYFILLTFTMTVFLRGSKIKYQILKKNHNFSL